MSPGAWLERLRSTFGRGVCSHRFAWMLELSVRAWLQFSPAELAGRLRLKEDSRVLEVGPGPGYFSPEIARRVPRGHLELFDLQPEMLEMARRKLEHAGLTNVGYTQGHAAELPLPEESFDVAFLVAVLGEVSDPKSCMRGLRRVLRPGGLLSISEIRGDPDFQSFPTVRALCEGEGFTFEERFGRSWNFTANFRKPA